MGIPGRLSPGSASGVTALQRSGGNAQLGAQAAQGSNVGNLVVPVSLSTRGYRAGGASAGVGVSGSGGKTAESGGGKPIAATPSLSGLGNALDEAATPETRAQWHNRQRASPSLRVVTRESSIPSCELLRTQERFTDTRG